MVPAARDEISQVLGHRLGNVHALASANSFANVDVVCFAVGNLASGDLVQQNAKTKHIAGLCIFGAQFEHFRRSPAQRRRSGWLGVGFGLRARFGQTKIA